MVTNYISQYFFIKDQLVYEIENYVGELYRMNLSCSCGGLPESGCLFFKVAGNTSTVVGILQPLGMYQ